ncbi:hypothetical protein ACA910_001049 [Epithemia clementina (nom. ined.)]
MDMRAEDQTLQHPTISSPISEDYGDEDDYETRSESSADDLQRSKAIDAIEVAWEESTDVFRLHNVSIDGFTAGFLVKKWDALCLQRKTYGFISKTIRQVVLDRCVLKGESSVQLMITFLNKIGEELKELAVTGVCFEADTYSYDQQDLGSLLRGLERVCSLQSLVVERMKLRGKETGFQFRCFLSKNPNLEVLQLFGSTVDDDFYDQLMIALKYHFGFRFLDVGALGLTDAQLEHLVENLVASAYYKNLQFLDISGSFIGEKSLKSLTLLLHECPIFEELILCSCDFLFDNAWPGSPYFGEFVSAINSSMTLRSIRLSHVKLYTPLFRALETETSVQIVHDMQGPYPLQPNNNSALVPMRTNSRQSPSYCTAALLFPNCAAEGLFPFSLFCGG